MSLRILIHAPLAGCDRRPRRLRLPQPLFQSTHPLRGATCGIGYSDHSAGISIHAPLAGCDVRCVPAVKYCGRFQSTHPLRGATSVSGFSIAPLLDFNPRTPCGVRRCSLRKNRRSWQFQSTHPLRGATYIIICGSVPTRISIHAPLAGCDRRPCPSENLLIDFNPRTPCGVRRRGKRAVRPI